MTNIDFPLLTFQSGTHDYYFLAITEIIMSSQTCGDMVNFVKISVCLILLLTLYVNLLC